MTDALDAVIDATLERAVLDGDDARRHLALAGALERARSTTQPDGTGRSPGEHGDPSAEPAHQPGGSTGLLGAALLGTVAVEALDAVGTDDIDPGAWSPGTRTGGSPTELVAVGAAAACRRLDVDPATVAARSGLPPERFARRRPDDGAATDQR